jgi:uncharacterized tellurite resistance protein B-like protein
MLTAAIREFLSFKRSKPAETEPSFSRESLAAAALMVECARIDGEFTDDEREGICTIVRDRCGLDSETAECLVAVAERKTDEIWHNHLFTQTIRSEGSDEQYVKVIDRLWEVALADGEIHRFEAHLVERIGEALGLSEGVVAERRAAAEDAGSGA